MSRSPSITEPEAPGGTEEAVFTKALTKQYQGGRVAVDQLDLSVPRGEVFGLLGPNGAGKTTTVGMLTTRVVPTSGRAFVGGVDVAADPVRTKRLIGVVPQHNTLDRSLTAWENLYFHGRYFGMRGKEAEAAAWAMLERFRLTDRANSDVRTLSGGMATRLMLARGLLHRPAVLFLDEPTAGLDPQSRLALWEAIGELRDGGQTVVLTTHYMEEAERLCDRVAIMDRGRVLALDTPERIRRSLGVGAAVTVKSDGDLDELVRTFSTIPGARDGRRVGSTVRLELDTADGALPKLVAAAAGGGFTLTDVSVTEPTLETVFIQLTGRELRE